MSKKHSPGSDCDAMVALWKQWDQNEQTRAEIEALVGEKKYSELHQRLCTRMEFGTAGLRGQMKAGFAYMNDLVIIQTTQGLVKHLLKCVPDAPKKGVVVGYDGRHNSAKWARIVANIMIRQNIPVYLFSKVNPTPFVPYLVLKKSCACGIMVTASHNPKMDNGYKVYWSNGAQISSPTDVGIATSIEENLDPWPGSWDLSLLEKSPLLTDPLPEAMKTYYEDMQHLNAASLIADIPVSSYPKFVYTPVHGVGLPYAEATFKALGLPPFIPVVEQAQPDPEFSTVKYPNPEEGPDTLDLAFKTADKNGATVVVANDPDADRFAAAEKQPDGKWRIFTGNQLGTLIGYWCWLIFRSKNPDFIPSNAYMLRSTVSSKMLESIASVEGFKVEDTLTGFKWICNRADQLMKESSQNRVVFAFEEAIGFMCGTKVLDKDGITTVGVAAQMIIYAYAKYGSLAGFLESLFAKYGYHHSINSYFLCYDPDTIRAVFDRLRYYALKPSDAKEHAEPSYPEKCGCYEIVGVRDLTIGYDNSKPDKKPTLPVCSSTQMITFTFANGTSATLRTSGTEPKIKYYTELPGKPGQNAEEVERLLTSVVNAIVDELLQPEKFGLKRK